jgi:hypothetical protein
MATTKARFDHLKETLGIQAAGLQASIDVLTTKFDTQFDTVGKNFNTLQTKLNTLEKSLLEFKADVVGYE